VTEKFGRVCLLGAWKCLLAAVVENAARDRSVVAVVPFSGSPLVVRTERDIDGDLFVAELDMRPCEAQRIAKVDSAYRLPGHSDRVWDAKAHEDVIEQPQVEAGGASTRYHGKPPAQRLRERD
jgi:hypothetical protein